MSRAHPDDTPLRTLDVAPAALTAAERERAEALLERIVAEVPAPSPAPARRGVEPVRSRPTARPRRPRRLLVAPLVVLAVAAVLVLAPGPGSGRAAYASWTPVSTAVGDRSLGAATSECRRRSLDDAYLVDGENPFDPRGARQVLAERRGDFVLVVHWSPTTDMVVRCVVHNPPGTDDVDSFDLASTGGGGTVAPAAGTFSPKGITDGTGSAQERDAWWLPWSDWLRGFLDDQHPFRGSTVDGLVGEGVIGVTVHAGAYTVQATVDHGKYVAWWPGPALRCAPQETGVLRCDPIMTYDLHLADGTMITDAEPLPPR